MSELSDVLLELRDVGIRPLPEAGDAGDYRLRAAVERETAGGRHRRFAWIRRKVAIGGVGVPGVVLGVVATAAAATGALMAVNATTIFKTNPQAAGNLVPETVTPSSVRELASTTIPNYGRVQFWGATTRQRGFCFAIKLPDGSWGGYPSPQHSSGGWYGGAIPGCMPTAEQQVISEKPGQARGIAEPLFWDDDWIKTRSGQMWHVLFGFVTVQGHAATVQDTTTHTTAAVTRDAYFLLVEPPQPIGAGNGSGETHLRVLNAAGQPLQPDYTSGKLLPGYALGPTSG
jgi:hypothetical protein